MSECFTIVPTRLAGLHVLERHPRRDSRGYLERMFCEQDLQSVFGGDRRVVQINRTLTRLPGTVRGLHFQRPPHAETKVVTCLRGEVFDVAVDIRRDSPTFGKWVGEILSANNKKQLWIPEGLAHGFLVLSDTAEFLYKTTDYYAPAHERCLRWDDPALGIAWPLDGPPSLSSKDQLGHLMSELTHL
jgi:dTDP-4-dehydrorhamnose 3,5-epimerase